MSDMIKLREPMSAHQVITQVIGELRAYNIDADEYKGRHIHKGWAGQLESVAPPHISESDEQFWVRNRAAILQAMEQVGYRLVSSGSLFWLSKIPEDRS